MDRSDPRRRRPASCGGSLLFAPRRRRYLAAPGDVLHAPLLNVDPDGTSVREPLRPGLDLVNAVCVDLHTARSSASASRRIALGSSARHVQYLRSTLGPDIDPHGHGTRSSDALGVRYPRNNSTERSSMSQSSRGDMQLNQQVDVSVLLYMKCFSP